MSSGAAESLKILNCARIGCKDFQRAAWRNGLEGLAGLEDRERAIEPAGIENLVGHRLGWVEGLRSGYFATRGTRLAHWSSNRSKKPAGSGAGQSAAANGRKRANAPVPLQGID